MFICCSHAPSSGNGVPNGNSEHINGVESRPTVGGPALPGGSVGGPAERARAGSVKAAGVEKLRQASSGEGRQRAIRISGFSSIKGLSGVDGVYAQNSPEAFYKVCLGFHARVNHPSPS